MLSCTKCGKVFMEDSLNPVYFIIAQKMSYNIFQRSINKKHVAILCEDCKILPLDIDTENKEIITIITNAKELRYFLDMKGGENNG